MKRCVLLVSLVVTLFTSTGSAHAELAVDKQSCIDAHALVQRLRHASRVMDAREAIQRCVDEGCPQVLRDECVAFSRDIDHTIPHVTIDAVAGDEETPLDATFTLDDGPSRAAIESEPMDPGAHHVRVEHQGRNAELRFSLFEGEHRRLRVRLPSPPREPTPPRSDRALMMRSPPPDTSRTRTRGPLPWIATGVAIVGGASFATFATLGLKEQVAMESSCAPACAPRQIDSMRTRYVIADACLGVSTIAAALAVYLWLR